LHFIAAQGLGGLALVRSSWVQTVMGEIATSDYLTNGNTTESYRLWLVVALV